MAQCSKAGSHPICCPVEAGNNCPCWQCSWRHAAQLRAVLLIQCWGIGHHGHPLSNSHPTTNAGGCFVLQWCSGFWIKAGRAAAVWMEHKGKKRGKAGHPSNPIQFLLNHFQLLRWAKESLSSHRHYCMPLIHTAACFPSSCSYHTVQLINTATRIKKKTACLARQRGRWRVSPGYLIFFN